jgi:uncharacterized membrane protein
MDIDEETMDVAAIEEQDFVIQVASVVLVILFLFYGFYTRRSLIDDYNKS